MLQPHLADFSFPKARRAKASARSFQWLRHRQVAHRGLLPRDIAQTDCAAARVEERCRVLQTHLADFSFPKARRAKVSARSFHWLPEWPFTFTNVRCICAIACRHKAA